VGFIGDIFDAVGDFIGDVVDFVGDVVKGVVGFATKLIGGIFGFGVKKPKATAQNVNNLNKSLDPETARKIVFGKIAAPLDLRFWEVWGTDFTNFDEVIALAGHQINSIQELYIEDNLAISSAGVVQTGFTGKLSRTTRLGQPGQTALSVGSATLWTSTSVFTGAAHMKLAWGPVTQENMPDGIPSRYTQVVEGALVYDPRRDSTRGGSGTHRANDQSTWSYATLDGNGQPIGRNNALQALWYLLGWRVTNPSTGEAMLVAGRGVDPDDINMATFIAGANACEVAGYYTDMLLSTDDEHTANEDKITCDGLIGRLIDPGGLWSYYANVDDTANIAVELTDDDLIEGSPIRWLEWKGMQDQFNQVIGKFVNPSTNTLYQPFAYPMVRDAVYEANLGRKVRRTQDFPQVLSHVLAQRLARLKLNSGQYQGELSAAWKMKAIKAQAWSVVRYTSERFGWTKLFRVWRHEINPFGGVQLLLKEIHASIWTAGTVANAFSTGNSNRQNPSTKFAVTTFTVTNISISVGSPALIQDAMSVTWDEPSKRVASTEVRYKLASASLWTYFAPVPRIATENGVIITNVIKGASYHVAARTISDKGVPGDWVQVSITAGVTGNSVTANATVLSKISPTTGRVTDPNFYNTAQILNIQNTTNINVTYTVGGSNVTVNIPAHNRKIAGISGPVTIPWNSGSIVVPFSSYWICYVDDPELNGDNVGSVPYVYTTNPNDLLRVHRYFVASGTSPASGGSGGSTGGGGGGGTGGDNCVDADSFMPNGDKAYQVEAGEYIEILAHSLDGYCYSNVERNHIAEADCVELTSESNIKLIVSKFTPCTLRNGLAVMAGVAEGEELAVRDEKGFRWERIIKVKDVGVRKVAHISCHCENYAAGKEPGRFIYTHNWDPNINKP
jgi:hypothetical protein